MNTRQLGAFTRQTLTGLRAFLVLTAILGIVYPVSVWAVGQSTFSDKANGQLIESDGRTIGSAIIGQQFTGPGVFHSRPSAGGYNPLASGPSNLGPSNPELLAQIDVRRAKVAKAESVPSAGVPADAVTASGSGLDPYVSPAYADLQVPRVARENALSTATVERLVAAHTDDRIFGFLGEPKVNVLELNLAVEHAADGS